MVIYTFFCSFLTQKKIPLHKKFASLALRNVLVCAISLLFTLKQLSVKKKYFYSKAWELKMVILQI
jgi:hypothetical protein